MSVVRSSGSSKTDRDEVTPRDLAQAPPCPRPGGLSLCVSNEPDMTGEAKRLGASLSRTGMKGPPSDDGGQGIVLQRVSKAGWC
jgi:hypothetical protein